MTLKQFQSSINRVLVEAEKRSDKSIDACGSKVVFKFGRIVVSAEYHHLGDMFMIEGTHSDHTGVTSSSFFAYKGVESIMDFFDVIMMAASRVNTSALMRESILAREIFLAVGFMNSYDSNDDGNPSI